MDALLKYSYIIADYSSANACVHFHFAEFANAMDHVGNLHGEFTGWGHDQCLGVLARHVDRLENSNGKSAGFTCARLSLITYKISVKLIKADDKKIVVIIITYLSNSILSLNYRQDSFHLDGWRVLVPVAVYATQNLFPESHIIKFVNFQIPVRFEQFFIFLFWRRGEKSIRAYNLMNEKWTYLLRFLPFECPAQILFSARALGPLPLPEVSNCWEWWVRYQGTAQRNPILKTAYTNDLLGVRGWFNHISVKSVGWEYQ